MATLARVSLLAHPLLLATLRHGATNHGFAAARPAAVAARRMLGSVSVTAQQSPRILVPRCGGGAEALRAEAADMAVPRSVPVRVAYELQQAGHRYLDVRTEGEFAGGHPVGAVNVPYMYKTGSGLTKNTHFLEKVSTIFGKEDEIIVGCQSGKRSLMAASELCSAGFTAVTDIAGGFSSWRENELPTNK
uniref:Rhodanese domain-containing protein n=1 Tax=Oryza punctata TaxID=4537 RepID=A0A0E0LFT5_ORYPU